MPDELYARGQTFKLTGEIARSGSSEVFKYTTDDGGASVALKVGKVERDIEFLEHIRTLLRSAQETPNVLKTSLVAGTYFTKDKDFVVMNLATRTFQDEIRDMTVADLSKVIGEIASIYKELLGNGIFYLDTKAENIFFDGTPSRAILVDYGAISTYEGDLVPVTFPPPYGRVSVKEIPGTVFARSTEANVAWGVLVLWLSVLTEASPDPYGINKLLSKFSQSGQGKYLKRIKKKLKGVASKNIDDQEDAPELVKMLVGLQFSHILANAKGDTERKEVLENGVKPLFVKMIKRTLVLDDIISMTKESNQESLETEWANR
jgi:hypothetical protein